MMGVKKLEAGAMANDEIGQEIIINEALEHVRLIGEIGEGVLISEDFHIGEIRRDEGERALLIGAPEPGFAKRIKVGKNVHELLRQLLIIAKAPMPHFWPHRGIEFDLGKCVERPPHILEVGVAGKIQLLKVVVFEADAPERWKVCDYHMLNVCAIEAFNVLKRTKAGKIESVGERVM